MAVKDRVAAEWGVVASGGVAFAPCDLVLVMNRKAGFIAAGSTDPDEERRKDKTLITHVGMMLWRLDLIEALSDGIRIRDMVHGYAGGRYEVAVFRRTGLTEEQRAAMLDTFLDLEGLPYGTAMNVLAGVDWLIGKVVRKDLYLARKLGHMLTRVNCSCALARACKAAGFQVGPKADYDPERVQPDDFWDDVRTWHPDKYAFVWATSGLTPCERR